MADRDPRLEPPGQDAATEISSSFDKLEQLDDQELGRLFRAYVEGLLDTQLEGFYAEEQWGIDKFLRDMILARQHGVVSEVDEPALVVDRALDRLVDSYGIPQHLRSEATAHLRRELEAYG